MGTEFRIADHAARVAFDLDKGGWLNVFPIHRPFRLSSLFPDAGALGRAIREKVYPPDTTGFDDGYCERLGAKIAGWAGDAEVEMFADCYDRGLGEGEAWEYPVTGDRFESA